MEIYQGKHLKEILESKITELEERNKSLQQQIASNSEQDDRNKRLNVMADFLKMNVYQKEESIPDTIIEKYVQEIVVDKDKFIWRLHPNIGNTENLSLDYVGTMKKNKFSEKTMCHVQPSTGCYQHETLIENPIFLGTYKIPKSYMKSIIGLYYSVSDFYFPKEMEIQLELI